MRELDHEEMTRFGSAIPWLNDSHAIPEAVTRYETGTSESVEERHYNLRWWMIQQFSKWATEMHPRLSLAPIFEKYDLSNDDRIVARHALQTHPDTAYAPGITSMSEIFAVVPLVAQREGVDAGQWPLLASRARDFGKTIARDGTNTQWLIRAYLGREGARMQYGGFDLDARKFRLSEETGITTVTPIATILRTTRDILGPYNKDPGSLGVCVALGAKPDGLGGKSMFDAAWDAYGSVAERYIYPHQEKPGLATISPVSSPDHKLKENLHEAGVGIIAAASLSGRLS
jgi:hypothetical protein